MTGGIELARIGPREGPTLVFLHEGLGSLSTWRDFPAELARATGLGALVYSRAGYGRLPPVTLPRPLTFMEDEAHDALPALLADQGVDRPILIGHSDGATIALVYAANAPVLGCVLEAPHVFCEQRSIDGITAAREDYERGELRRKLAKHHSDVDVAFWGWNRAWLDPAFRAWNIEQFLPRISAPMLLIQGEEDAYGTRAQVDAIAQGSGGPVETMMLVGCGHTPHREAREVTLAAMTRFVRARV